MPNARRQQRRLLLCPWIRIFSEFEIFCQDSEFLSREFGVFNNFEIIIPEIEVTLV